MRRSISIENFKYGTVDSIEAQSIPRGAASDALNWLTKGDHIELRRGSRVIGTEQTGSGGIRGLFIAHKADGTTVKFTKRGRKLLYYDTSTSDWVEVGTNLFPVAATSDDVFFDEYQSPAGNQLWFSSPNSSLYKILTANPGSYSDQYDSSKNFYGYISIRFNRMRLWGRVADQTGKYGSYIDTQAYTTVTAEAIASLSGTLAFKGGDAKRTCFAVAFTITASGETYTDDYCGNLTGSLGGTGTINYMTGAYTLSNAGAGTCTYQWENSTVHGIADFTKSATRLAGEGFVFRQDDGGPLLAVASYGDVDYCLHKFKPWALTLTATDTGATNLPYRENIGIPSVRAVLATGSGVYFVNTADESKPIFSRLTLAQGSTSVEPQIVSNNKNLENYTFDDCEMGEWNEYIVFTGKIAGAAANNRMFLYNKTWKSIDIVDYFGNVLVNDTGTLLCGESISNNVVTLFSGYDDDDALIDNHWIGNIDNLDIKRLKKNRKLRVRGLIQTGQNYKIYASKDNGAFTQIGAIDGNGTYVDRSQSVAVGALTIGSTEVGGGSDDTIIAYNYVREFTVNLDKFEDVRVEIVAEGIGYVSISEITYQDIRLRSARVPLKYRG